MLILPQIMLECVVPVFQSDLLGIFFKVVLLSL